MYDVVYLDSARRTRILAANLERASAADLARAEARRRRACRMFVTGSALAPSSDAVLIVASGRSVAA